MKKMKIRRNIMCTYIVIWYDLESEKCRDEVVASNPDEAVNKATLLHNGTKPAPLATATPKELMS